MNGKTEYWGNSYSYDPWGNLLQKTVTKCSAESLSVTALWNNQLSGYGYDAAGNMTSDPTAPAKSYIYDAENRITSATMNGATTSYTYDADGNRVEKSSGNTGTIYWYMTPGIVAESDLSGSLKSEYIFFDGERVARKDFSGGTTSVAYYFSDHLKTTSVITNSAAVITEDEDYYPWGGELQFVNSDSNHYKFTGKERDSETGLDYFGARYYGNWLGRFVTPDWSSIPEPVPYADPRDPQSLNQYSYVRNIPTSDADAEGHDPYIHINEQDGDDKLRRKSPSDCPGLSDCSSSPGPASPRAPVGPWDKIVAWVGSWFSHSVNQEGGTPEGHDRRQIFDQDQLLEKTVKQLGDQIGALNNAMALADPTGVLAFVKAYLAGDKKQMALAAAALLVPSYTKITAHGAAAMIDHGVSMAMVQKAVQRGARFYDPVNDSIVFVLQRAMASGKDLGVAVDRATNVVKTVFVNRKAVRSRFIPLP